MIQILDVTESTANCDQNNKYSQIHVLSKYDIDTAQYETIFPQTVIAAIHDNITGAPLEAILRQFNCRFIAYLGTGKATRNSVPISLRRKGLILCYDDMYGDTIVEMNIDASEPTTDDWGNDNRWLPLANYDLVNVLNYINSSAKYGFNVTVGGIKGGTHTLASAILDVPMKMRAVGQMITFYTENEGIKGHWVTYQYLSDSLAEYEDESYWADATATTVSILEEKIDALEQKIEELEQRLEEYTK